jgi:hypothetical protein
MVCLALPGALNAMMMMSMFTTEYMLVSVCGWPVGWCSVWFELDGSSLCPTVYLLVYAHFMPFCMKCVLPPIATGWCTGLRWVLDALTQDYGRHVNCLPMKQKNAMKDDFK